MVMKIKLVFIILLIAPRVFAQVDPIDKKGIAIGGYDLVAYFESGKAIKGNQQIKAQLNNVAYYFSSEATKKLFEASPEKYLPQYEGYCALAVSYGKKISIDPNTFKVANGKLYLFFNGSTSRGKINSLETWNNNEDRLIKKAEQLWPDVKKKKYKPEDTL